jgi:hypothetical protein
MFAGHLAPGLVLKKMERRLNLAWLFFAGLFHDFLFGILVLLGVEQRRKHTRPFGVMPIITDYLSMREIQKERNKMFRLKIMSLLVMAFAVFLASCAPGAQYTLPPDMTLMPGTDIPQQVATYVANALTQTMMPPATSTPVFGEATLPVGNEATFTPIPGVIDSSQPLSSSVLKPADSDSPAAGICGEAQGDPVSIVLGIGPDGIPLAGRCIKITPAQHIKLINQSNGPFNIMFGEYHIDLPVGNEMLLDKPVDQYLAFGVHALPMGPELWVKEAVAATVPPPIVEYNNSAVGYRLNLPGDWRIDETGGLNKEVIFNPPNAEPFVAYLSVSLDARTLDQIIQSYAQNNPDAAREDTIFNGYPGIKYAYRHQNSVYRIEYYIPYGGQLFLIATDRPSDSMVQSILMTIRFTGSPSPTTYEATLADNGKTFVMKVGDKLKINLDYSYVWSLTSISNPAVIAGAQDGYFALASGSATLSITGNPECLNSTPPCGMPSIMYTITVIVQ